MNSLEHFEIDTLQQISDHVSNQFIILQSKDIQKHFDHNGISILALDGINPNVEEGDFICIVGQSGCGKSTFLNIVAGLEKSDNGEFSVTKNYNYVRHEKNQKGFFDLE